MTSSKEVAMMQFNSQQKHQELLAQYNIAINDIKYAKDKMWSVVRYALLLDAAFISVNKLTWGEMIDQLYIFGLGIGIFSGIYIIDGLISLINYRKVIVKIRNNLSGSLEEACCKIPNNYIKWHYDFFRYPLVFLSIIAFGVFLTLSILRSM